MKRLLTILFFLAACRHPLQLETNNDSTTLRAADDYNIYAVNVRFYQTGEAKMYALNPKQPREKVKKVWDSLYVRIMRRRDSIAHIPAPPIDSNSIDLTDAILQ